MPKINTEKIDLLLQYALVVAGQGTGWDRELGMIHTRPMVNAAPGEYLDFNILRSEVVSEDRVQPGIASKELTVRQKKKRKSALSDLKKRINARLDEKQKRRVTGAAPPRYDEVFFDGLE